MFTMRTRLLLCCAACLCTSFLSQAELPNEQVRAEAGPPFLNVLAEELNYSMAHLATKDGAKPYYLSYMLTDTTAISVQASLGALYRSDDDHQRILDVDIRVGDYALDSTHQIRG